MPLYDGQESVKIHRLFEKTETADFPAVLLLRRRGHQINWNWNDGMRPHGKCSHEVAPIHDWHHHVQQDQTRVQVGIQKRQGFPAIFAGLNGIALLFKKSAREFPNVRIVFDDQDARKFIGYG